MKLKTPTDIIIIDPYNIAKDDNDWGPDEVFDWKSYEINSSIFTEYIWSDCGTEGVIYEIDKKLNEIALNDIIGASKIAIEEIENMRDRDYFRQSLNKLRENQKRLGTFSPIVGCIGAFILDEALEYNPNFLSGLSIGCYTIIKKVDGRIILKNDPDNFNIMGFGSNKTFYSI